MADIVTWLGSNAAGIGVVIAVLPIVGAGIQFILSRRTEEKRRAFDTYHGLIKQLVESENPQTPMRLDRQIAVIFELRHFKLYYPVTLRIMRGLKNDWGHIELAANRTRLMEEIDLTIAYIEKRI